MRRRYPTQIVDPLSRQASLFSLSPYRISQCVICPILTFTLLLLHSTLTCASSSCRPSTTRTLPYKSTIYPIFLHSPPRPSSATCTLEKHWSLPCSGVRVLMRGRSFTHVICCWTGTGQPLQPHVAKTNKHLPSNSQLQVCLHNGLKAFVVTGPPRALYGLVSGLQTVKVPSGLDQSKVPFSQHKSVFSLCFLVVDVPYHSNHL